MIAAGSLIGFGVAFLALAWALSAVACAVVWAARRRLAAAGPAVERGAAALALALPPVLAAIAVIGVAVAQRGLADHCAAHGHHLHLCLTHGGGWAERVVPVALVVGVTTALLLRTGRAVAGLAVTGRALAILRRAGTVRHVDGVEVVITPSNRRLSLATGVVTRRVFVSTAVWQALSAGERTAVLAHETAHARGHDVLQGLALAAAANLGAPGLAGRLLAGWRSATERLRDRDAARACGDVAVVGAALLKVARLPAPRRLAASAGLTADVDLTARIEALLAEGPIGARTARRLTASGWAAAGLVTAVALVWSGPLHHALETLLAPL